jgi:MFS family permease
MVLGTPWLWITIVIFSLVNITMSGPMSVALPFLVKDTLGADVQTLGVLLSMASIGSVAGAVWLGSRASLRRRGWLAYGASLISGLMFLLVGLEVGVVGIALALFVNGLMMAVFGLVWTNTLQEMVPREMMGRVISVDMLGSFVLLPVGYGLAGWLTDRIGAPQVFLLGGALTVVMIGVGLLHPAIRKLD